MSLAQNRLPHPNLRLHYSRFAKEPTIMIHDGKLKFRIDIKDIRFVRAEHVYVRIFLGNGQSILYRNSLSNLSEQLEGHGFIQVHRSYLVNPKEVSAYGAKELMIGDEVIPVSRARSKEVVEALADL